MRVECPQCKEVSIAHILEVREGVVCFSCTKCESHFSHPVAANPLAPKSEEFEANSDKSDTTCPKCGKSGSLDASACEQCGLSRDNFASYQGAESEAEKGNVDSAWEKLETQWASEDAHKSFVNSLLKDGDFRAGAAKYRQAAASESKRERCEEMMAAIQKVAAVALLSSKPKLEEAKEPFGSVMLLLVACFVLAGASVLYAVLRKDDQQGATAPSNRQEVRGPRTRTIPMTGPQRKARTSTKQPAPKQPAPKQPRADASTRPSP